MLGRKLSVRIVIVMFFLLLARSMHSRDIIASYDRFDIDNLESYNTDASSQCITNCDYNFDPEQTKKKSPKGWTFIVYMAADNDLRGFAARNIKQMAAIGSNEFINIVIQLDIRISGNKKITRRYFIEKGRVVHVNDNDPESQQMDSGAPETLISCCKWAITQYPAQNYALVFWNHGTGILDPDRGRIINATELFSFNPTNNKYELDRSIGFFDFVNAINAEEEQEERGICWDDSTGNYLSNQALDYALNKVMQNYLQGQKFGLIGFDACLMSMLEVGNIIKKYAQIMVGCWRKEKVRACIKKLLMSCS